MDAKKIVGQMTLEEKAGLCSGLDFWHMKGIERLGLPSLMVTDGPHGLRKQIGSSDHLGINDSVKATCFPPACTTSASFDRELIGEMGKALADECLQEDVAVLLGPGMNAKRSPLCGRNFEYISEDPFVTGQLSAALINGIQSKGIGTSPKHYAANTQEFCRMTSDSVVDERAMRELYLTGFEIMVKESNPMTIMCSYNRVDGTYVSENKRLLNDILRDEWGFEGIVMTDWGATNDRVDGLRAGLDLEMPSSGGLNDAAIVAAVQDGSLDVEVLDKVVERLVKTILSADAARKKDFKYDASAHNDLARRAAAESSVLLKNDGKILPMKAKAKTAVIGAMAKDPRYQGAGSSLIQPLKLSCALEALEEAGVKAEYAEGYSLKAGSGPNEEQIAAACKTAEGKDIVLLFVGLPSEYESEGFDRSTMDMPESHNLLIERVAAVNSNVVVVLQCGSPVTMPWLASVKGVLLSYLGGQAGGSAVADVLLGKVNPSGKLAETFPLALEDTPSYKYFPGTTRTVEYRESIFVGYRYYDTVQKPVLFPFGYGLSYTSFEYSGLKLSKASFKSGDQLKVTFSVKNTGKVAGGESVQVYVGREQNVVFRAAKELKGFDKVFLKPQESKKITITLDDRSFAYYNVPASDWAIEAGGYSVMVGANSQDICMTAKVKVAGDGKESLLADLKEKTPEYFAMSKGECVISDSSFATLLGRPIPPSKRPEGEPFNINSTLGEVKHTFMGKRLYKSVRKGTEELFGGETSDSMDLIAAASMEHTPLRTLIMMGQGKVTHAMIENMLKMMNGNFFGGLFGMMKKK